MGLIWKILDLIYSGPALLFALHQAAYWAALAVWSKLTCRNVRTRAALVLGIGMFPPLWAVSAMVWKDVSMGVALLLGCALIARAEAEKSKPSLIAAGTLILYGLSVRLNAAPAIFPLLLWVTVVGLRLWGRKVNLKASLAGAFSLAVGFFGATQVLQAVVVSDRGSFPLQQVLIFDLGELTYQTGDWLFPGYPRERDSRVGFEAVHQLRDPLDANGMVSSGLFLAKTEQQYRFLKDAWLEAVSKFPGKYLAFRTQFFLNFINPVGSYSETYIYDPRFFDAASGRPDAGVVRSFLRWQVVFPYFAAFASRAVMGGGLYFWAIPLVLLIVIKRRKKIAWGGLALATSAWAYMLAYWPVGTALNLRYAWWAILCALLLPFASMPLIEDKQAYLFLERLRKRPSKKDK